MCVNLNLQQRLESAILQLFESPGSLIKTSYLKQLASEKGITDQLYGHITDRLVDYGWIRPVVNKREKLVFAYRITDSGWQKLRQTAKRFQGL